MPFPSCLTPDCQTQARAMLLVVAHTREPASHSWVKCSAAFFWKNSNTFSFLRAALIFFPLARTFLNALSNSCPWVSLKRFGGYCKASSPLELHCGPRRCWERLVIVMQVEGHPTEDQAVIPPANSGAIQNGKVHFDCFINNAVLPALNYSHCFYRRQGILAA